MQAVKTLRDVRSHMSKKSQSFAACYKDENSLAVERKDTVKLVK